MYTFIIDGETPPKKNSRITLKNGKTIPSKNYTAWHDVALSQVISQNCKERAINLSDPVEITMEFTHGDLRKRDSDNQTSSILDLLKDAHILLDDNWCIVQKLIIINKYEKNNAKCTVFITKS